MLVALLVAAVSRPTMIVKVTAYHPSSSGSGSGRSNGLPFLRRQDMVGIWTLTNRQWLSLPSFSSTEDKTNNDNQNAKIREDSSDEEKNNNKTYNVAVVQPNKPTEIVVRLHDDGSFTTIAAAPATKEEEEEDVRHSKEEDAEDEIGRVLRRGGSWEYQQDQIKQLILAPNRPKDANPREVHDTLFTGEVVVKRMEQQFSNTPDNNSKNNEDKDPIATTMNRADSDEDETNVSSSFSSSLSAEAAAGSLYDFHLSIPQGQVAIGKFMYPKTHKAFFDEPMLYPHTVVGSFSLMQLLGNLNARLGQEEDETEQRKRQRTSLPTTAKFHKKDFYGKRFYLTSTPLPVNPHYAAEDKHYDQEQDSFEFRVVPLTFYANNTFSAQGSGKILRGRFGITGETRDRLWMQVNLFGAGRSAPGSVYSEGPGLSQEDRRGYRGMIQTYPSTTSFSSSSVNSNTSKAPLATTCKDGNETSAHETDPRRMLLCVDGDVFYGNDLGIHKRPSRMATFTMQEIVEEDDSYNDDDDDDDGDDDDDNNNNNNNSIRSNAKMEGDKYDEEDDDDETDVSKDSDKDSLTMDQDLEDGDFFQ
jgi:hypothetical protein